jgi:hypothetical protein
MLCIGTLAFSMPVPLARSVRTRMPLYPGQADRLRPAVLGCRVSPISSNASSKRPWGLPCSDP